MKKLIFLCFVLFVSKASFSQIGPEELITKFFNTYKKNTDKAIEEIYATNSWTSQMQDGINNLKKVVKTYPAEMGEFYGYEMITKQKCTENFVLYAYMMRYDRQPMKVSFEFYKPNDKWMLFSLNFSSDLDEDVEQATKMYLQFPKQD